VPNEKLMFIWYVEMKNVAKKFKKKLYENQTIRMLNYTFVIYPNRRKFSNFPRNLPGRRNHSTYEVFKNILDEFDVNF